QPAAIDTRRRVAAALWLVGYPAAAACLHLRGLRRLQPAACLGGRRGNRAPARRASVRTQAPPQLLSLCPHTADLAEPLRLRPHRAPPEPLAHSLGPPHALGGADTARGTAPRAECVGAHHSHHLSARAGRAAFRYAAARGGVPDRGGCGGHHDAWPFAIRAGGWTGSALLAGDVSRGTAALRRLVPGTDGGHTIGGHRAGSGRAAGARRGGGDLRAGAHPSGDTTLGRRAGGLWCAGAGGDVFPPAGEDRLAVLLSRPLRVPGDLGRGRARAGPEL